MRSARELPGVAELDAVTIDAFGTLLRLDDPTAPLRTALARHTVDRSPDEVRAAFLAEVSYYRPRSLEGHDDETLADLRHRCVQVFLDHLEAEVDVAAFVPEFIDALVFRLTDGASSALDELRAAGIELACVANWDVGLLDHLERLGVASRFALVLPSAAVGSEKPDPAIFGTAVRSLGVRPSRALHVGDEDADRLGAEAAGLSFAPAPLATLPQRLGLG